MNPGIVFAHPSKLNELYGEKRYYKGTVRMIKEMGADGRYTLVSANEIAKDKGGLFSKPTLVSMGGKYDKGGEGVWDTVYVNNKAVPGDWSDSFYNPEGKSGRGGSAIEGGGPDYQLAWVPEDALDADKDSKDDAAWENFKSNKDQPTKVIGGKTCRLIPVNVLRLKDAKSWGIWGRDDVGIYLFRLDGKEELAKYADSGWGINPKNWGLNPSDWFDSQLDVIKSDVLQRGTDINFHQSLDGGIWDQSRNNWSIKAGDMFYNVEGDFTESAMMHLWRQMPTDQNVLKVLSMAMASNDNADDLTWNIGELTADAVLTIAAILSPYDLIAGDVAAIKNLSNTARKLFYVRRALGLNTLRNGAGYYRHALKIARLSLGQYNIWGLGTSGVPGI